VKTAFDARDVTRRGVPTDGSSRYPEPWREVCGAVPHQRCALHVLAEVVKAVVGAVASARKGLGAKHPTLPRGRPRTKAAQKAARKKKRLEQQRADVCTHRYLCVQHHRSTSERKTLWHITRGLPPWRKLRAIMEQVSTVFDRRGRTQPARDKLAKLRRRLQRFTPLGETRKKLFAPTLEKALTFLDDPWLPSTSNAVERGNRRYRTMQKSLDSVRTQEQIKARIALDMWREAQGEGRHPTIQALHEARAGCIQPGSFAIVSIWVAFDLFYALVNLYS
jgi:hypothetical protein